MQELVAALIYTSIGTVQVCLGESQSVSLYEARVELHTEDDLTTGRLPVFVIANHLKQTISFALFSSIQVMRIFVTGTPYLTGINYILD